MKNEDLIIKAAKLSVQEMFNDVKNTSYHILPFAIIGLLYTAWWMIILAIIIMLVLDTHHYYQVLITEEDSTEQTPDTTNSTDNSETDKK